MHQQESQLKFKTFKTNELIEYVRNPRNNDAVVDKMVACIKEFGFRIPIVAKSDGSVVDGHLRLKAAKKLGLEDVPVVIADDLSEAQIKAFRLVANQSANWAEWDDELLKLELEELKDLHFDPALTGFDLDEIESRLKEIDNAENSSDEIESQEDIPTISQHGDLWILGEHRLLCGDSTRTEDVQKLMAGKLADFVFTDPPYNVKVDRVANYGKVHHDEFAMASGEMSEQEFINFLSVVFKNLIAASKDGSLHYICMDWKHIYEIITAGLANYSAFKQLCVWNKGSGGMGSFYRSQHELIFVFKNGKAQPLFHSNRTNVWDYPGMNNFAAEDRNELVALHPTVKSLPLVKDAILDASDENDLVLDLFGGSGTTLIACEDTGRKCCMMEYESKYVDTIIRRWQQQRDVASKNFAPPGDSSDDMGRGSILMSNGQLDGLASRLAIHAETGKTFEEIAAERCAV